MNGLMHPNNMVDYARKHHNDVLRLVEAERVLKSKPEIWLGLSERILSGMNDLMKAIRLQAIPKERKVVCRSTCDGEGMCKI